MELEKDKLIDIDDRNAETKLFQVNRKKYVSEMNFDQGLDHPMKIEDVLVKANATNIDEIVARVNDGQEPNAASSMFGKSPGGLCHEKKEIQVDGGKRHFVETIRNCHL